MRDASVSTACRCESLSCPSRDSELRRAESRLLQLVDDARRERFDGLPLRVAQLPEPRLRASKLGLANLVRPRTKRRDRRYDVEGRLPRAERVGFLGDDLLGPLRL